MAKQQQPKASWLDRRREAKRARKEKKAQRIASQYPEHAAGAERAARHTQGTWGGQ
jgi:hypothetical protein